MNCLLINYGIYKSNFHFFNKYKLFLSSAMRPWGSQYRSKYCSEVKAAINKQIQSEHQASMEYLAMAVRFLHPTVSYTGAGGYFMKMYKEELHHMEVLINYQLIRGGTAFTGSNLNNKRSTQNLSLIAAFNQALEMEKSITQQLEDIVSLAEASKDVQSADFITSKFLKEQMHSIYELSNHVTVLNRLCGDEHGLWQYDKKLIKSYPYSLKLS